MIRVEGNLTRIYTGDKLKQSQASSPIKSKDVNTQYGYGNLFTTLDIDYVNYLRETVPKTTWDRDYLSELWSRKGEFLNSVREKNGEYDFDDIVTGVANAYSSLYQEIIGGYNSGTRKLYVYDKESGERRLMSKDEELEKLNSGFDELIKWEQMVAKSRMETEKVLSKIRDTEFKTDYSICEVTDYIQETYSKYRQLYLNENSKSPNFDINRLVSSILNKNPDIHNYCLSLFNFAKMNCVV